MGKPDFGLYGGIPGLRKKIKICHVINAFENGGAEAVILNYVSHMDRKLFDFHIISHGVVAQVCEEKFRDFGFTIHFIASKKSPMKHLVEMYRVMRKEKFDILHIATTEWAFVAGIIGLAAGCKHRINHSHMAEYPRGMVKKGIFHVKTWLSRVFTNTYWACGTDAAKVLFGKRLVESGEVTIFHNAIDIEKYEFNRDTRQALRSELGLSPDAFVIGNVGRFSAQKNHMFLIDIFEKICQIYENSCLVLVGEGSLKDEVVDKVRAMGLESRVRFLGARNDVNRLYQMMDLLLMPSLMEGLPLVGIEAQISGLKILFSSVVTKEVNFTGNCEYEPLSSPPEVWAQHACGMRNPQRKTYYDEHYDIARQAICMEEAYIRIAQNEKTASFIVANSKE